jgi:hypothetical protein
MSTWGSLRLFLNRRQPFLPSRQLCDRRRSDPRPASHRHRGRLRTRFDSAYRGTSTGLARLPAPGPECPAAPEKRCTVSMPGIRGAGAPPGTVLSGAVGEIESAVQRVRFVLRVLEPCQGRTNETFELLRIGRFLCEDVSRTGETLKRRPEGHLPIQSPRVSAARAPASRTRFLSGRALKTRRLCTPWG